MTPLKPQKRARRLAATLVLAFVSLIGFESTLTMSHASEAPAVKNVALVFDDGPHPENAPRFLELFAKEDVRVSFAQVGRTVAERPEITLSQLGAGHEIVNHSYSHARPKPLSDEELEQEIVGGQRSIEQAIGFAPRWYWPPYLERDPRMSELFEQAGVELFEPRSLVSSEDWNQSVSAEEILREATTGVEDGSVILFHEWRRETLEQMPAILAALKKQGCAFHTFSELAALYE